MGMGVIVVALAAVIGGTALMPSRLVPMLTLACVLGSILYRIALALALSTGAIGLTASDVNVVTAVLVAYAASLPGRGSAFAQKAGQLKLAASGNPGSPLNRARRSRIRRRT